MKYSVDEILEIVKRDGDFEYDLLEMGKIWGYRSLRFNFHRRFRYDFETGKLFYRYSVAVRIKPGDEVGSISCGYLSTKIYDYNWKIHRIIMIMFDDNFDETLEVDHKNGIRNDNRLENLRMVTSQDNNKNVKIYKCNKSGEVGISWYKKGCKWKVQIYIDGKQIHGGYFTDFQEAKKARDALHKKHGFHPNHGRHQRTL